ncbi:hypothetical protein ACIQ9P_38920 [Kitasatospora sp. NPDC094019]|uniref:hypothetical protein n=1 Tax=Kitasatospora sp. NPDC094019 TaxID=3364091 RepID=UPI003802B219
MGTIYTPKQNEQVRDQRSGKVGEYMDTLGGLVHLRPPGGGCEWTTDSDRIEPLKDHVDLEPADPNGAPPRPAL